MLCAVIVATLSLAVASPAESAPKKVKLTLSASKPIAGETVTASGKVPSKGKRTLVLEQRQGRTWKRIARATTTSSGAFRASFKAKKTGPVRARAPRKGRKAPVQSLPKALRVAPQSGVLTVPKVVLRTQQASVRAAFTPARPGRKVSLQGRSVGGSWTTIATGSQDGKGRVGFSLLAGAVGQYDYRATTLASKGASARTTAAHRMRIDDFDVELSDDVRPLTDAEQEAVSTVDLGSGAVRFAGGDAPTNLRVGQIISIAPQQGAPSGALRRVRAVAIDGALVTAQTEEADLTDVIERMPESEGTVAMCSYSTQVTDLADGAELQGAEPDGSDCVSDQLRAARAAAGPGRRAFPAGVTTFTAPRLDVKLNMKENWEFAPGVSAELGVRGTMKAAPVVEFGLDTNWHGKVTGYRLGGGFEWDVSTGAYVKVTGKLEGKAERKFDVAAVVRTFGGTIGPVPVWADLEGRIVLKTTLKGEIELNLEPGVKGRDMIGITNTSQGNLAPKVYVAHATPTVSIAEVKAAGSAGLFTGAEVQLSAFSVGGPFLNLGPKVEADIAWSTQSGTTCTYKVSASAELGLQTSDLLKKWTGGRQSTISKEIEKVLVEEDVCPPGTDLSPGDGNGGDPDEPTPGPTTQPPAPHGDSLHRVSVAPDGTEANGFSSDPAVSADGRYIAFFSAATNLVPGDTNRQSDVFVTDRTTGTTTLVSRATDGTLSNGLSTYPSISADGRYITYLSTATNLVPGDTNRWNDLFVTDRISGTTTRINTATDGTQAFGTSNYPKISADGRYIAFFSEASNLVPGDTNDEGDIFVRDVNASTTTRISTATDGTQGNGASTDPAISADGRFVAYSSEAWNLVPGDNNSASDVFVTDRTTGTTSRASTGTGGVQARGFSHKPSLSADGRFVAYYSGARLAGDTNGFDDVFLTDRVTLVTTRLSTAIGGTSADARSYAPVISADGRYIAYESSATNLVPDDTNGGVDVFVTDRTSGVTTRVSTAADGSQGNGGSRDPSISADGRHVSYASFASNLVPDDTNATFDVFVRELGPR